MSNTIYTATGCARCKITKQFMQENSIDYEEYDFKGEGKEAFSRFYRANRSDIYRDKDGVEFPVFTDGKEVRQGVSVVIGYLLAGDSLAGFISRSVMHGEWIDGFDISGGDPVHGDRLLQVMAYLKKHGLKIQLTTDGRNADLLQAVLEKGLADRAVMEVKGPAALYGPLTGTAIDGTELQQSIAVTARFDDYRYYTTVAPLVDDNGENRYLEPEEVGNTAKLIEAATGSKKHPYLLRTFDHSRAVDERLKNVVPLPQATLFKYRAAARRYMVMTEIEKTG